MQKGFAPIIILVGILVVVVIASGTYFMGRPNNVKPQLQNLVTRSETPNPSPVSGASPVPTGLDKVGMSVKVFFHNKSLANDPDFLYCDKVFPVNRSIATTKAVATAALNEWLKGPTTEEKNSGYSGGTEGDVSINSIKIVNSQAFVDLHFSSVDKIYGAQPERKYLAGTCGIGSFLSQIDATVKQFPSVNAKEALIYSIDGSQDRFKNVVINP